MNKSKTKKIFKIYDKIKSKVIDIEKLLKEKKIEKLENYSMIIGS